MNTDGRSAAAPARRAGSSIKSAHGCTRSGDASLRELRTLILGAQLALLREHRRIGKRSLAERIGVDPASITRIEQGGARNLGEVRAFVDALDGTMVVAADDGGYSVTLA